MLTPRPPIAPSTSCVRALPNPLRPFTDAQERIAELLADGLTAPAIAVRLQISYHTVRTQIRAMARVLPGEEGAQELVRAFALARRKRAA
jgi:DNA-binding CsgD family transcriptional regulator